MCCSLSETRDAFCRMSSLRHIINSIGHSIWPLLDALFIVMIVVCMYGLIGMNEISLPLHPSLPLCSH